MTPAPKPKRASAAKAARATRRSRPQLRALGRMLARDPVAWRLILALSAVLSRGPARPHGTCPRSPGECTR